MKMKKTKTLTIGDLRDDILYRSIEILSSDIFIDFSDNVSILESYYNSIYKKYADTSLFLYVDFINEVRAVLNNKRWFECININNDLIYFSKRRDKEDIKKDLYNLAGENIYKRLCSELEKVLE